MLVKDENGFTGIANPIQFSDFPKQTGSAAPALGSDNNLIEP
jgi:crotonobetainyl-CoA:carnitine CoA-transferase CaiB-like acyl-CoA transferase